MKVKKLIELLQLRDEESQVLVEGAAETYWAVSDVTDDEMDTTVFLLVGERVPVQT